MKKVLLLLNEHEDPLFLFQILKVATNNRQSLTKISDQAPSISVERPEQYKSCLSSLSPFFSMIRIWIGKLFWMTKPKILMIIPS